MTWPAFAPGCESLGIGLSVKISRSTSFIGDDNQYLQSFSYCGPEGPTCTTPASISLQVPSAALVPCFQLDAHIAPRWLWWDRRVRTTAAAPQPTATC